jgi:predicted CopG family antitoxin
MHKKVTITLDAAVYEGLCRMVGKRRISKFIEDMLRPHVLGASLEDGYKAMAQDQSRETEAMEWTNGLAKADTLAVEDAIKLQLGMPR